MQKNLLKIRKDIVEKLKLHNICEPEIEADIMLSEILAISHKNLFLSLENSILKSQERKIKKNIKRRISGEPLQYIIKKCEFYGAPLYIKSGVFIPRPETEILVEEAIKVIQNSKLQTQNSKLLIADVGCGSGCISVVLAKNIKNCKIYAIDVDKCAIFVSRKNAKIHNVQNKIKFLQGEYLQPLFNLGLKNKIDFIIFNPPYVKKQDIPLLQKEVSFEPIVSIDGGNDGLDFYRNIAKQIPYYIKKDGFIITEIGIDQKDMVCNIFTEIKNIVLYKTIFDYSNIERVLIFQYK